jgi:preprotein translocase subunit SecE
MATEEDVKREKGEKELAQDLPADESPADASSLETNELITSRLATLDDEVHDVAQVGAASPTQMGTRRFVYAAYFAGGIAIAFLMSKILGFAWFRLQSWKPWVGEPHDEVVMPVSALIGAGAAVYYWYRTRARQLAEEVATEMSKVTWPTRTEVTNGTFVVIVTTVVSTVFFALMDRFWGFLTNLVYGGS